jgi:hypothetical protein
MTSIINEQGAIGYSLPRKSTQTQLTYDNVKSQWRDIDLEGNNKEGTAFITTLPMQQLMV